eukprot:CAMPEP_0197526294 /NCGR_PEP_ID=MMETSP1318-20131121/17221_1 /TAXON_ID=552666 /ORGANISM="Partenskyella glossopodia, Strain RCC365" /LENGTH=127 /DNA_ID=CAMNT_0043080397 /DNA_START=259 /DNA_END=642 /DNA_ORIENTATION=+
MDDDDESKGRQQSDPEENPYEKMQMDLEKERAFEDRSEMELDLGFSFGSLKESVDSFLIATFFFVCLSLAWLATGVGAKYLLKTEAVYEAWYALWTPVFQPALGILMLGSIVSGVSGWLNNKTGDAS